MNKLRVIARSTFIKNIKSWGYWTMVFTPFILMIVVLAIGYFAGNKASEDMRGDIAVIDSEIPVAEAFGGSSITVREDLTSKEEADKALREDDIAGIISIRVNEEGKLDIQVTENGSFDSVQQEFEQIMTGVQSSVYAQHLDLSPDALTSLFSPVEVNYESLAISQDGDKSDGDINYVQLGLAYIICFATFMLTIFYAQTIINEIAADKGTRMMEVILSSTTAKSHFIGKILGVSALLFIQLGIYLVVIVGGLLYFRDHELMHLAMELVSSEDQVISNLIYSLIFFILALALYILLSGFMGSLVNKSEDAAKVISPISILLVIGFYVGIFGLTIDDNLFFAVMSYIPFFGPFVMPFRMAGGVVETWHIWLSIGINIVFLILFTRLCVQLYKSNVLIYSDTSLWDRVKRSWRMSHQ